VRCARPDQQGRQQDEHAKGLVLGGACQGAEEPQPEVGECVLPLDGTKIAVERETHPHEHGRFRVQGMGIKNNEGMKHRDQCAQQAASNAENFPSRQKHGQHDQGGDQRIERPAQQDHRGEHGCVGIAYGKDRARSVLVFEVLLLRAAQCFDFFGIPPLDQWIIDQGVQHVMKGRILAEPAVPETAVHGVDGQHGMDGVGRPGVVVRHAPVDVKKVHHEGQQQQKYQPTGARSFSNAFLNVLLHGIRFYCLYRQRKDVFFPRFQPVSIR
jgi:hypothetical protein